MQYKGRPLKIYGMGKLNEGTQIKSIKDEYVLLTDPNGQQLYIKLLDLAEAVRSVMPVVTSDNNGLMNKDLFADNGSLTTGMESYSDDIDELHLLLKDGLSTVACTMASTNRPYPNDTGGVLVNINRVTKFSMRLIYQQYISVTLGNKVKSRTGRYSGSEYIFSNWE